MMARFGATVRPARFLKAGDAFRVDSGWWTVAEVAKGESGVFVTCDDGWTYVFYSDEGVMVAD